MMKRTFFFLAALLALAACSDNDSFTTDTSARLTFVDDTVKMDTVFSTVGSATYTCWVFNHSGDGIRLKSVRLRSGNQTGFRVNVDGSYLDNSLGSVVSDLEVRKGDSLRVFVELTAPENGQPEAQLVEDDVVFTLESGREQLLHLRGYAWDALQLRDVVVSRDSTIDAKKPVVIYGGIRVDSAATLTIRGATLYFHDKAGIDVYGRLQTDGALLRGDRLDHMFDYLPYDRVSGQWRGLHFYPSSSGNELLNTEIRNPEDAIIIDSAAVDPNNLRLYMEHCMVHNCKGFGLCAVSAFVGLQYCQLTNTLGDCVAIYGGAAVMDHCTLAQFYPFSASRGAALRFTNFFGDSNVPLEQLQLTNSIVTGYADDVVMGEMRDSTVAYNYYFENDVLRTPPVADTLRFVNITWEEPEDTTAGGKKHFVLIDEKNLQYDFHLDSLSTVQGMGCY
ncbi:MAG: right-handed parallel beta-helix repeat-containing protein [Prevotella sp.]|nr:right-handed parallel beta-helix repeat-containing protein [Prevotella sp.]